MFKIINPTNYHMELICNAMIINLGNLPKQINVKFN